MILYSLSVNTDAMWQRHKQLLLHVLCHKQPVYLLMWISEWNLSSFLGGVPEVRLAEVMSRKTQGMPIFDMH